MHGKTLACAADWLFMKNTYFCAAQKFGHRYDTGAAEGGRVVNRGGLGREDGRYASRPTGVAPVCAPTTLSYFKGGRRREFES
jgi:hypothetical protein